MYRALRRRGYAKDAAARIANARTPGHTVKAPNYGARMGQTIAGNLVRGEGGKFSSSSGSPSKPASPDKARQQAERAQQRAAEGQAEADTRDREDAYIAGGKNGKERQARRREVAAARRKRAAERRQNRANERITDAQAQAEARWQQQAAKPEKEPKKGGGGGGGKGTPSDDEKRAAQDKKKRETADRTARDVGIAAGDVEALRESAAGNPRATATTDRLGLTKQGEATDQGRRALVALERGDVRGYQAALQDARARMEREAAAAKRQAERDAKNDPENPANRREAPTAGATRRRSRLYQRYVVRRPNIKTAGGFAVFKDAAGRERWTAITSSAYEDQDREIITVKGLAHMVAVGDRTGQRGPLRYWHVPGFDLGDCDFQATTADGRFLIESGTFRSKAAADLGRRAAAHGWQMSPGFSHPPHEPYPAVVSGRPVGLYDHPIPFERSICPPQRASNPYTRFITKEHAMLTEEKRKALEALAPDLLDSLLAQVETQKSAADDAGAVYKDAPAWAQALIARIDALEATKTVKADMPPPEMVEAGATELADGAMEEAAEPEPEMDDGPLLTEADLSAIAQAVVAALAPALDIEKKMRGYVDEMKGMLGGGLATKDAAIAELTTRVGALEGDQPTAAGYRPSTDPATALPPQVAEAFKASPMVIGSGAAATGNPVADFLASFNLGGNAR